MNNPCLIFQLNILKTGLNCTFQLNWGERQQLTAELNYAPKLDLLYQDFRSTYEKAYSSPMRGKIGKGFSITDDNTDWENLTQEKTEEFLKGFHQWMGSVELKAIQDKIISVITQPFSNGNLLAKAPCVTVLIASNADEIVRLPWENWTLLTDNDLSSQIHISRTVLNAGNEVIPLSQNLRRGKPRILAILAAEESSEKLNINPDRKAINSLSKVVEVQVIQFEPNQDVKEFKATLIEQLVDERGWDVLIFAGHSEITENTGGRLRLAANIYLSLSQLQEALIQAKIFGLRLAIFNSCEGVNIASFLIQLGLHQVVVMREKIHDLAAHEFLLNLTQGLGIYQNIQKVFSQAVSSLKQQKITYPGAYLVPSLFCHPSLDAELFRFESYGLQRWWRDWKPTKREAITLGVTLFASLLVPVQDLLLEPRFVLQAVYRDIISQLHLSPNKTSPSPPILLVSIDRESIYTADELIEDFEVYPMDREYLSQLISQLSGLGYNLIGIDYLLDRQEGKEEQLVDAINQSCQENQTYFVVSKWETRQVINSIQKSPCVLQGDSYIPFWSLVVPNQKECLKDCSFAYNLVLLNQLITAQKLANSSIEKQIEEDINSRKSEILEAIASINVSVNPPWGMRYLVDFSLDPKQVYQYQTGKELLEQEKNFNQNLAQIAIISPGVYDETEVFPLPLALQYWCNDRLLFREKEQCYNPQNNNPRKDLKTNLTRGQAVAYQLHHLNAQHYILVVPDFYFILLGSLVGKGVNLWIYQRKDKQHRKIHYLLFGMSMGWGLIVVPFVYLLRSALIPIFVPIFVFWTYILSNSRRTVDV